MKTTFTCLAGAALLAAPGGYAADAVLYGQINRGVFAFGDGVATDAVVGDNYMASSRFGFKGEQKLDNGLAAGMVLESEMFGDASNQFVQQPGGVSGTAPLKGAAGLQSRQEYAYLSSGLGSLAVGKLSTAIDTAMAQDLAGARDVMGAEYRKIGGGLKFRDSRTGALSTFTVNSLTEGQSTNRANAVRYESPVAGGLQGKASVAQGGDVDAALFYGGGAGDWKTRGAVGVYLNNDEATGTNVVDARYLASLSVAHASGLAATVALSAGSLENKTPNAKESRSWYAKAGYAAGRCEFAVDAGGADHFQNAAGGSNGLSTYGVAAQYNIADGVSLAVLFRQMDADVSGTPTDGLRLYGANMKVRF